MTLHFADGFDHYAIRGRPASDPAYDPAGGQVLRKWDGWHLDDDAGSLLSAGALGAHEIASRFDVRLAGAAVAGYLWKDFPAANATWTVGFALNVAEAPGGDAALASWQLGDGPPCHLGLDGGLHLWVGTSAGAKLGTSAYDVPPNSWTYVEWRVTLGPAGAFEVRIGGHAVLSGTGDTQGDGDGTADRLLLGTVLPTSGRWAYDDLFVTADDGGRHTGFLCPEDTSVIVFPYIPTGGGGGWDAFQNGVPQENPWSVLWEMEAGDDDVTYTEGAGPDRFDVSPYNDLWLPEDPPATAVAPAALQWVALARSTGGTGSLRRHVAVGGAPSTGGDHALTGAYTYAREVMETNPLDGTDWTVGDMTGIEVGYDTGSTGGVGRVSQLVLEAVLGLSLPPPVATRASTWAAWWP